jgi:hypothetical protein
MKKYIAVIILVLLAIVPQIGYCQDLLNSQFVVKHGTYSEVTFRVGILEKGELSGSFKSSDSVYVYVFDENGYNLFKQGNKAFPLYNSGKSKGDNFKINLGQGRYWIIFDAKHAIMIDRTVAASVVLN